MCKYAQQAEDRVIVVAQSLDSTAGLARSFLACNSSTKENLQNASRIHLRGLGRLGHVATIAYPKAFQRNSSHHAHCTLQTFASSIVACDGIQ